MNPQRLSLLRREFLQQSGLSLGAMALGQLLAEDGVAGPKGGKQFARPLAPRTPHYPPKAKAVIQLFMAGGPSQLELFDYKPKLQELHGQPPPKSYIEGKRFAFLKPGATLLGTKRKFAKYGESGAELSEMLPHTAKIADDIAIIRTLKTDNFNHGPAKLLAQTGYQSFGKPTMGAWTLYGLGSECKDLPGYIVLQSGPRGPRGGAYLWSNGFLPSIYQGAPLRSQGDPMLNLTSPKGFSSARQQRTVEAISQLNGLRRETTGDHEIAARTANYELAFRMQSSAPDLIDVSKESQRTLDMYGVKPGESSFAFNCLLARRLVERGVRFITLFHTEWDHHGGSENLDTTLARVCGEVDQSSAALVQDLKQRGLWNDTLVTWGGEFGRTPMGEPRDSIGRDHHIECFSTWLSGGGIKGGQTLGETDELGFYPKDLADRVHVHDLHATILHLLGLDHLKLTHRFQGRDFRLTDVDGKIIKRLLA